MNSGFNYWFSIKATPLVAILLGTCVRTGGAELLTIRGRCTYTNLNHEAGMISGFRGVFSLSTDFTQWRLEYADPDRRTRQEATFDGTNTYTVLKALPLNTNNLDVTKIPTNVAYIIDGVYYSRADTAGILPRQQPVGLFAPAQLPWFAATCCGLLGVGSEKLLPPWISANAPEAPAFVCTLRDLPAGDGGCRRGMDFTVLASVWHDLKLRNRRLMGSAYDPIRNFVEGEIRVLGSTNVLGRSVPIRAEATRFFPMISGITNPLRASLIMEVTNVITTSGKIELPQLTRATHVSDGRFQEEVAPGFVALYAISNNAWISESNAGLHAIVAHQRADYLRVFRERGRSAKGWGAVMGIAIAILLLSPGLFVLLSRRRNAENHSNANKTTP